MTRVTVRFAGGLELLVGGRKRVDVHLPPAPSATAVGVGGGGAPPPPPAPAPAVVGDLIAHVRAEVITERHDAFATAADAGVRPGILVLINDVDWELEGTTAAALADGDVVSFISTLHGG
ncbi:hypothetical protein BU14_0072s0027 [Porphyra umbilicalis]|uniref:Ubiquitin-related modifier 1 homolog n=1 Tax=Porphyra umbilicalis TaxID=2786 RepID=A0A1X6PFP1_PORUM|nr:hypothetical protein BU14_0072s0027 [Porphyra umbilicalis]|eukprot:OSX79669.1 hypothetical protein BU14_0072s0027 [Porphyra umbilicalis]